jgi:hypothetical protein
MTAFEGFRPIDPDAKPPETTGEWSSVNLAPPPEQIKGGEPHANVLRVSETADLDRSLYQRSATASAQEVAGGMERILASSDLDRGGKAMDLLYAAHGSQIWQSFQPGGDPAAPGVWSQQILGKLQADRYLPYTDQNKESQAAPLRDDSLLKALENDIRRHEGDNAQNLPNIAQNYLNQVAKTTDPSQAAYKLELAVGASWWRYEALGKQDLASAFSSQIRDQWNTYNLERLRPFLK